MKSITIIGFLGANVQKIKDDQHFFISVGVKNYKQGNIASSTDWFKCYGPVSYYKGILPYLISGQQVCVMGSLYFEEYLGKPHPKIQISHIELIGTKKELIQEIEVQTELFKDTVSETSESLPLMKEVVEEKQPSQPFLKRKKAK